MNYAGVLFLLGRLLLALAAALLVPAAVALREGPETLRAFAVSAALVAAVGLVSMLRFRQPADFSFGRAEAFVLVTVAWVTASLFGALPYVLLKGPGFAVDGFFESASGFTTTGASVLADVESEARSLLLWRAFTQWLGGMGIIVLGIAILPKLAVGGMELLGAEAPGPIKEKLTPRIAQTAKALWGIYTAITAAQVAALVALGLPLLDAVAHAFATMATGGFSTRNAGLAAYGPSVQAVVTVFMVLAGANFALHFHVLRGRPQTLWRDTEFRLYLAILAAASLMLGGVLVLRGQPAGRAALDAVFQAVSITTTTGFATADFDRWPHFCRVLLLLLMFVGGCTGSTGGSVKVIRVVIAAKKVAVDIRRLVQPHAVLPVRVGARAIPEGIVTSVTSFVLLFVALFAAGGLLLTLMGIDPATAFSASAACLGNVGPGLGDVGPTATYAPLPAPAKLLLAALMIVGRLELYTVLVLVFVLRPGAGTRAG